MDMAEGGDRSHLQLQLRTDTTCKNGQVKMT